MLERVLDWLTVWVYRLLGPLIALSHKVLDRMPRPLDPFRSIKLKLSILLGMAGATGLLVFWLGVGWIDWKTAISAAIVGLITLQVFAHGMTKPLREMTAAARSMARGDYRLRVRATSRDEVGELLDLSKVDSGAVPLKIEEFDLRIFLTEAIDGAALSNPTVHFVMDELASPLTVKADPARLHQVFANLLDNAARHSPAGGTVTVSANRGLNVTVFDVTDRGTGIPPHQRNRVFERFFTDSARSTPGGTDGGTGLGLAIARWVVGLHHGTIAIVDPPDGVGCRVRITLPLLEDHDEHRNLDRTHGLT